MNDKIDLFFKRTLENHRITPGVNTWSAIEGKLVKKNKNFLWVRLAASVVLCALLVLFWTKPTHRQTNSGALATHVPAEINSSDEPQENKESATTKTHEVSQPLPSLQHKMASHPTSPNQIAEPLTLPAKKMEFNKEMTMSTSIIEEKSIFDDVEVEDQQSGAIQSIVLVYTLPSIQPKADSRKIEGYPHKIEKHNNLKKVLELAGDLRTGESNLNSVRQTKNEILAFQFMKNEKNN